MFQQAILASLSSPFWPLLAALLVTPLLVYGGVEQQIERCSARVSRLGLHQQEARLPQASLRCTAAIHRAAGMGDHRGLG